MNTTNAPVSGTMNAAFEFDNYDPNNLIADEVINAVFIADVSSSVGPYVNELTKAYNDMKNELGGSHVSNRLLLSTVMFATDIKSKTGFQPVTSVPDTDFQQYVGGSTSLYRSTLASLQNAIDYRNTLENSGIGSKTLIFVITDGGDTEGHSGLAEAKRVKDVIQDLLKEERNYGSFTSILFGIGTERTMFEDAKNEMGFQHLGVISDSAADIRKMINFISASISSTAAGQQVSSPNF